MIEDLETDVRDLIINIDGILKKIYDASKYFDLDEFSKLVANFNKGLNSLLTKYHEIKFIQPKLKPFVMFYRQFFQELMVVVSQESVPEELLEQIRNIIDQKDELISNYYTKRAKIEGEKIGRVSQELEKCLKKRFEAKKKSERKKENAYYS